MRSVRSQWGEEQVRGQERALGDDAEGEQDAVDDVIAHG